ncbi:MAG: response regulator transcription factor [Prevotellaceae bacterium]|jgi:DNA-binding response OmpR family regulator|nr:response regulator transcription factor [Prevotellaceae bacterium]
MREETRILVVDDEEDICDILRFNLEDAGYLVDTANSAEEALQMNLAPYNLILLDVMMGEISGFRMATQLKKNPHTARIPIIFLTAKDTENDTVTGFNVGADDYINKPFSVREILMRIRAVLRRTIQDTADHGKVLTYRNLEIDLVEKRVMLMNKELSLTKKEFELLTLLLSDNRRVFSRDDILNRIWKNEEDIGSRTVDVNITRLRKKIGEYGKYIVTKPGYGYCFDAQ